MAAGVAGGGLRYGTFTPSGQARDVVLSPEQLARLLWDGAAAMARVVEDLEAAAVVPDGEAWHS